MSVGPFNALALVHRPPQFGILEEVAMHSMSGSDLGLKNNNNNNKGAGTEMKSCLHNSHGWNATFLLASC